MPHDGFLPDGGPPGLVKHHLLAFGARFLYYLGQRQAVAGLETLHIDQDHLQVVLVGEALHVIRHGDVLLVAHGDAVGGLEPGHLAHGGNYESAALADEGGLGVVRVNADGMLQFVIRDEESIQFDAV